MDLRSRMATVVVGDSTRQRKPHPDPILLALREMGVTADKAIYVGDAPTDIASGKAAGTTTVAVTWGYIIPGNNPRDWQAVYTIDPHDEFAGLLFLLRRSLKITPKIGSTITANVIP